MTKDEALRMAMAALEEYTNVVTSENDPHCWVKVVDGGKPARDAITAIREVLAQPERPAVQEDAIGSPCPEFWEWLPTAYNFEGNGAFTKYNMEVAFLAGKQSAAVQGEPVAWDNCRNEYQCRSWCGNSSCASHFENTTPQPAVLERKPLTDEEIETAMPSGIYDCLADPWDCGVGDGNEARSIKKDVLRIARAIEAAHGIKGDV